MRLIDRLSAQREPLQQFIQRHSRGLTVTAVTLMAGFGVTAFGVAPLVDQGQPVPQRELTEPIASPLLSTQVSQLEDTQIQLYRSDVTRSSDSAESLLRRLNIADTAGAQFLRNDATARRLLTGRANKMVQAISDDRGQLQRLVARYPVEDEQQFGTHFTRLTIERKGEHFEARLETAPLQVGVRLGSGTIRSSLFAATDDAGIPDPVASQMAEVFSGAIDFHRELRKGDRFSVMYEALEADGEPINWNQGAGKVLATQFVNAGKTHEAFWFQEPGASKGNFYSATGESLRRAFLASPLAFSRVTSGFAMRFHPIHKTWRAHLGVDYGAPTGTPVRVVGDGIVDIAGWQNGYGNVVHVKHAGGRTTVYAHLSRVDVRKGQRVDQGQTVGAVGATGWATGPHLHFEFRVNGEHQDPLKIARASEAVMLSPAAKPAFAAASKRLQGQLSPLLQWPAGLEPVRAE